MAIQEINLLPPERRRRIRNESIAVSATDIIKSVNSGLIAMTLLAAATGLALWIYSVATIPTTQQELDKAVAEYQDLRNRVAQENAVLERLELLGRTRVVWSSVLHNLFTATPAGITFTRLGGAVEFDAGEVQAAQLNVDGQALTRNILTVYEERLRQLPGVTDVNAPTSNLLERSNPMWQFTILLGP